LEKGLNPPYDPPKGGMKNTDIGVFTSSLREIVTGINPPYDPPKGGIKNTDIKVFTGNGQL
jgi:hypothetical protein